MTLSRTITFWRQFINRCVLRCWRGHLLMNFVTMGWYIFPQVLVSAKRSVGMPITQLIWDATPSTDKEVSPTYPYLATMHINSINNKSLSEVNCKPQPQRICWLARAVWETNVNSHILRTKCFTTPYHLEQVFASLQAIIAKHLSVLTSMKINQMNVVTLTW